MRNVIPSGKRIVLVSLLLWFGLTRIAHAAPITVPNFSFEIDSVNDGDANNGATGWIVDLSKTSPVFANFKTANPSEAQFTGAGGNGPLPAPAAGAKALTFEDTPLTAITNTVPLGNLEGNLTYTLTVAVGADKQFTFGNYEIELLAGGTTLVPTLTDHQVPAQNTFSNSVRTYVIPPGHPSIGSPLVIRLSASSGSSGTVPVKVYMDNVRLDASPTSVTPVTQTWNGGGNDDNWGTQANWGGSAGAGGTPLPNDGTAQPIFAGTTRLTPKTDVNWDVYGITYSNTAGAFTNSGMQLKIEAGGVVNQSANVQTISNNIVLVADQDWGTTGAGPLIFGGAVDNNGFRLRIFGAPSAPNRIYGTISGSGGLTKTGSGTLSLDGSNIFTGPTLINEGKILVNNAAALDINSEVTLSVAGSASLDLNNINLEIGSLDGGGSEGGGVALGSATLRVGGNNLGTLYEGIISGVGGLTKIGDAALGLSDTNTFSGPTTISGGTLYLTRAGVLSSTAVILNDNGTLFLGADATLNNPAAINFSGGTLEANNANQTFGALSLISDSTINLNTNAPAGVLTFSSATVSGGSLTVNGWTGVGGQSGTDDRIIVNATPSASFLSNVRFTGFLPGAAYLAGTGEIVPAAAVPPTPPTLASPLRLSSTAFQFTLLGTAGQSYTIQSSSTLTNWISILTTNAPSSSFAIMDTNATNALNFYRALANP